MIKIKKISERSLEENAYYHGVVCVHINDYMEKEKIRCSPHEYVKFTFGVKSTATLNTAEFENLMETIRSHAEKYWKLEIPLPKKYA